MFISNNEYSGDLNTRLSQVFKRLKKVQLSYVQYSNCGSITKQNLVWYPKWCFEYQTFYHFKMTEDCKIMFAFEKKFIGKLTKEILLDRAITEDQKSGLKRI